MTHTLMAVLGCGGKFKEGPGWRKQSWVGVPFDMPASAFSSSLASRLLGHDGRSFVLLQTAAAVMLCLITDG